MMIEARELTKWYGQHPAVDRASFDVDRKEIVGLLGPNGAGKSTTMRIITCFVPATSGTAKVGGFDIFSQSMEVRRIIGYMPENVPLYPEMRVREYLEFRARLKGMGRSERRRRIPSLMEECWIAEIASRICGQLSKGFRQRVGLAEALLHDPEILILDEPTVGLDPNQIRQARNLIRALGKERTVVLSTHILPEVEMLCSRVLIMNKGAIVPEEEVRQMMQRPALLVAVKGDAAAARKSLEAVAGVKSVMPAKQLVEEAGVSTFDLEHERGGDVREAVFRKMAQEGMAIVEMRKASASLEEVFMRITSGEEAA